VERISLNKFALKAITTVGAKEPSRDAMTEILEFCSNVSKDQPIGEDKCLGNLAAQLSKLNENNG
jgi:hypothetical protein